jgi:hypothetical protein
MARCRINGHRSRNRAARPLRHFLTQVALTPCSRATSAIGVPSDSSRIASKIFPTLLGLPGNASKGKMRSREPQLLQDASRTKILVYPSSPVPV